LLSPVIAQGGEVIDNVMEELCGQSLEISQNAVNGGTLIDGL